MTIERSEGNKIESERIRRNGIWQITVCPRFIDENWPQRKSKEREKKRKKRKENNESRTQSLLFFRIVILKGNFNTFSFFQGRIAPGFHQPCHVACQIANTFNFAHHLHSHVSPLLSRRPLRSNETLILFVNVPCAEIEREI